MNALVEHREVCPDGSILDRPDAFVCERAGEVSSFRRGTMRWQFGVSPDGGMSLDQSSDGEILGNHIKADAAACVVALLGRIFYCREVPAFVVEKLGIVEQDENN